MENELNYDSLLDDKDVQNTDDGQVTNFNDIQDAFIKLSDRFSIIKIPAISSIEFGDLR